MKVLVKLSLLVTCLALTACYQKHLILQAEVVSMTEPHARNVKDLRIGEEVSTKWCSGEGPVYTKNAEEKDYGFADQVIYKAQTEEEKADFITGVRIYRDTNGCALLEGKLAYLK